MRKIFNHFRHWLHNKMYKPKHQLTGRGIYLCYYIIEKYINETQRDDFNQEYEEMIDKKLARIESTTFFNHFKNQQGNAMEISDSDKRDFAAQMVIAGILYLCRKEERNKVYAYIKNENILELIKKCVEEGFVF